MINFQDKTQNLAKCSHFEKFIFIQKCYRKTCHLLGKLFLITGCKIFHSKTLSYEKVEKTKKKP
jgi:hypothetical protein